ASTEPTRVRDIGRSFTRGACGPAAVKVRRGRSELELKAERIPAKAIVTTAGQWHDLPGDTFQRLSPEVGYLKLSSVKAAEASSYIDRAAGTKGLIIDIRNYPSEFV